MTSNKSLVVNLFKLHGLTARSDGAKYLCELLEPLPKDEHEEWIEKVIEAVQKLPISSTLISKEDIHKAAKEVGTADNDDIENLLQVVDIFRVPRLTYNNERKKFVVASAMPRDLHGEASDKAALFRERYTIVHQRTCNHDLFRQPVVGTTEEDGKKFGLTKVEYLLGSSCRLQEVVVLGLLTQLIEGQHHLEDDTGAVQLDLSDTKFHNGLFTHNCFILVEGWYEDGLLHANAVGLPPPEAANSTRARMGNVNYFGGQGTVCTKNILKLQQVEQENKDAMFVLLSDVWLDKIKVTDKLRTLFAGYSHFPPTAFIFCGNFLSSCHGANQASELQQALASLGSIISGYPELITNSRFIFVPGPNDPGPGNIFPRWHHRSRRVNNVVCLCDGITKEKDTDVFRMPSLPEYVTEEIKKTVPNSIFVSNPCRLLYCTQEIVIFRENIVAKMCRNCIYFPTSSDEIPSHFAKTLVSQGHLAPLPLHVLPVYWGLDHCLSLHPTPDLIITADKGDAFTTTHNESIIVNPGSFSTTDFSFKVYTPATRQIEDSQIGDNDDDAI